MTVKEVIKNIPSLLKAFAKKLGTSIANAKFETLVKIGLSLGLTISVVMFVMKFLKDKRSSYTDENEKTVVDEALGLNFHDIRKQKKLHPLMNKVVDELEEELKPRTKSTSKKARRSKAELDKIQKDVAKRKLKREYDDFLGNMKYEESMFAAGYEYDEIPDTDSLVGLWNS